MEGAAWDISKRGVGRRGERSGGDECAQHRLQWNLHSQDQLGIFDQYNVTDDNLLHSFLPITTASRERISIAGREGFPASMK